MGLYKRGSVWWMDFVYRGKRVRKSTETEDRKLAHRIYDKIKGEIAEGKWFPEQIEQEKVFFKDVMLRYLEQYSKPNKVHKTYIRDDGIWKNHFKDYFGEMTLDEITRKVVSNYKTKRQDDGAKPKTINSELTLLHHVLRLAIQEWEVFQGPNPVDGVSKLKVNNLIERWMSFEEEEKLLEHSLDWMKPILILGIETGMRQSELLDLRWSNVNLFEKTITILEQKNRDKSVLPLTDMAMEILKARAKVRSIHDDLVFFNKNGNKIDARDLLRAFYSACKKAKIKNLRWHDATRHTFASRACQGGVDLYALAKLGRWKSLQMVQRYAHHNTSSLMPGIKILNEQRRTCHKSVTVQEKGVTACAATP